jgi:hypothetical protein
MIQLKYECKINYSGRESRDTWRQDKLIDGKL